jgi:hypothetical protein
MNKGILLAVVVTLLSLPPALALRCDYLSLTEKDVCIQISSLPISEQEQESLLSASLQHQDVPNHALVSSWNNQISMTTAPENVSTSNKGVIKNAWLKIADVMPSVIENNTLYCDSEGKVQTFYNYTIQLPSGNAAGDCKTIYSLSKQTAQLSVFLNSISVGHDLLSSFQTDSQDDRQFYAKADIQAETRIDHYQNYKYCCGYYLHGVCGKWCTKCKFANTEIKTDALTVSDNLTAKSSPHTPTYNFTILNDYNAVVKGLVTASNYTNFILSFAESSYKKSNYIYDYVYSLSPYNVATIRAIPQTQEFSSNLNIKSLNETSFEFIVKNRSNCQITLDTFFSNVSYPCYPEIVLKGLSITADKLHYFANELINVSIYPRDLAVSISYANSTYLAQNSILLDADTKYSRIDAFYNDEHAEKVVSVTEKSNFVLASEIFIFIAVNYLIFSILTKEAWIRKWLTVAS